MSTDTLQSKTLDAAGSLLMPTYAPLPIVPSHGLGSTVYDTEGRDYIDVGGGIAVTALGHCHPALTAALERQASKLWHLSNIFANEPEVELAAKLIDATFADRVFLSNSGAEANEAAFKLSRRHAYNNGNPEKFEIVALHGAFHGRTLFTVSVGGTAKYKEGFGPTPEGIVHVAPDSIEDLTTAITGRTCAVILEPILGEGGVRPLDPAFIQSARGLCDDNDALLIFDEIQTGTGRTGTLFAYEQLGVTPDVLTSAKALGGGMPIGATLAAGPAAEALGTATHGSTFGGNPLACAVACAVIDEVTKPELMENVAARRSQIVGHLQHISATMGLFGEIRGSGLLIGAELADAYRDRAKELQVAALAEGVISLIATSNVLRFAPALNITEPEVDTAFERLTKAAAKIVES